MSVVFYLITSVQITDTEIKYLCNGGYKIGNTLAK